VYVLPCSGVPVSSSPGYQLFELFLNFYRADDVTEGCLMMSLPEEKDKGRAFSIFWAIVCHVVPSRLT
jgi:hypothetical protein